MIKSSTLFFNAFPLKSLCVNCIFCDLTTVFVKTTISFSEKFFGDNNLMHFFHFTSNIRVFENRRIRSRVMRGHTYKNLSTEDLYIFARKQEKRIQYCVRYRVFWPMQRFGVCFPCKVCTTLKECRELSDGRSQGIPR